MFSLAMFRIPCAPPRGWNSDEVSSDEGPEDIENLSQGDIESDERHNEETQVGQPESGKSTVPSKWLSGTWPLKPFDDSLGTNKRKAEWIRFRNQFERIVSCKGNVDPQTKLTFLKIHAGTFLLGVIEMQEKSIEVGRDVYESTVAALSKYFNQLCDTTHERMKFREMKMKDAEAFADWVLRLEAQAKFCEFSTDQRKEEFVQALLRRSVPAIAEKLYEMSDVFENSLDKIISHGHHLDHIRSETEASAAETKRDALKKEASEEDLEKPVNAVTLKTFRGRRFEPYKRQEAARSSWSRSTDHRHAGREEYKSKCRNCGRAHAPRQCKAFRAKCFECGKNGHFAEVCESKGVNKQTTGRNYDRVKTETENINQVTDDWD